MIFWKWGGGSKAVWNFPENSFDLVAPSFPEGSHSPPILQLFGTLFKRGAGGDTHVRKNCCKVVKAFWLNRLNGFLKSVHNNCRIGVGDGIPYQCQQENLHHHQNNQIIFVQHYEQKERNKNCDRMQNKYPVVVTNLDLHLYPASILLLQTEDNKFTKFIPYLKTWYIIYTHSKYCTQQKPDYCKYLPFSIFQLSKRQIALY